MPTTIYTAPAASGKTQFAINLARSTEATQRVRVVVASSGQARMWQRRLAQAGGALGVEVMIFDRMVAAILAEAGESWTQLSEPVQYRLLRSLLDGMALDYYAELRHRPGFVDVVQQLIPLLKSALIEPEKLTAAFDFLNVEPRLTELSQIYETYQTALQQNGWADRIGLHWLALEALEKQESNPSSAVGSAWPLLIVDGFDDLTPAEIAILKILNGRVGRMVITLTQPPNVNFNRYAETLAKLKLLTPEKIEPLPHPIQPKPLTQLASYLFTQSRPAEHNWSADLRLIEATDRPTEIRAALRWLKQRIVQDGYQPAEVALVGRNIDRYRPFIQQVGREFGLPIRIELGQLLNRSPIIDGLLSLLALHLPQGDSGAELGRRQLVNVWRSPWFDWQQAGLASLGQLADRLDNLGRHQRVIGGMEQWSAAFAAQIAVAEQAEDQLRVEIDFEEQAQTTKLVSGAAALNLQNSFNLFLEKTAPPHEATSFKQFVQWLEGLIGHDQLREDAPQQPAEADHSLAMIRMARAERQTEAEAVAALLRLKDILRGLVWAEEVVGQQDNVTFEYFYSELSGAINTAVYDLPIAKGSNPLIATNINQARGLSWKAVAIVGLSEGEFPQPIGEDQFLRDADRKRLKAEYGFQLDPSTQSRERELFYEAVSRATDRLLLTRPIIADNGAEWVPSPYWDEVRKKTGLTASKVTADALLQPSDAASEQEWLEALATADPNQLPAEIMLGKTILDQRSAPAQSGGPSVFDGDLAPVSQHLTETFGPNHVWSASRLESLRQCGMLFFVSSVLKVEPRPEPQEGLDVAQLGTLYHEIFEVAYRKGVPDTDSVDEMQAFVTDIAEPILDEAPEKQGFRETAWWSQTKSDVIGNVTKSILELAKDNWTFYQAEAAFGLNGNRPLVLQRDGDQLQLRGFIDRVDQNSAGELRIVDYKLGSNSRFGKAAFEKGEKLQLPLYALAVELALGLGDVTDGFYFHFRQAKKSGLQLAKYDGGPEQAAQTAVEFAWQAVDQARAGHFEPTPPKGGCPSYCPAAQWCWRYQPSGF